MVGQEDGQPLFSKLIDNHKPSRHGTVSTPAKRDEMELK